MVMVMKENQNNIYFINNNVLGVHSTHNYTNKHSESLSKQCKNRKLFKEKFDFGIHGPLSKSDLQKEMSTNHNDHCTHPFWKINK